MLPGQFVRVQLLKGTRFDVVTVPQTTIQSSQGGAFLWIVMPDSTLERRFVITSDRLQKKIIIDSGVEPGELVVVEGIQKARQGLAVEVLESIEEYESRLDEQEAAEVLKEQK